MRKQVSDALAADFRAESIVNYTVRSFKPISFGESNAA